MFTSIPKRNKVFICYHPTKQDERYGERLKVHLSSYMLHKSIDIWDRKSINSGDNRLEKIRQAINLTRVAVILLSPDLLNSNSIYQDELIPLFEATKYNKVTLLPVLLSACDWKSTPLGGRQLVNADEVPLNVLPAAKREMIWEKTAGEIVSILNSVSSAATSASSDTTPYVLPASYQQILDQLADRELEPQKRIAIAYSLIESAEILERKERDSIQAHLHSTRMWESDTQVRDALTLVLGFLHDHTAYNRFQAMFLNNSIPQIFRTRAAIRIAQTIDGIKLITLLTGDERTNNTLQMGLEIVNALQWTERTDLKIMLRDKLDQYPFTAEVYITIKNAIGTPGAN